MCAGAHLNGLSGAYMGKHLCFERLRLEWVISGLVDGRGASVGRMLPVKVGSQSPSERNITLSVMKPEYIFKQLVPFIPKCSINVLSRRSDVTARKYTPVQFTVHPCVLICSKWMR